MGLRRMTRPHPGTADPLPDAEKRRFVTQGFLHVASAVSPRLVRRARRASNQSLGSGIDRRDVGRLNAQSFCEELVGDPRLLRLATNPGAWSCVRSLVGSRRVERPTECQIALRFPRPEGTSGALDPPHLTTSPQANHNNRSGQLIWYINRSNQNLLDNDDEIA